MGCDFEFNNLTKHIVLHDFIIPNMTNPFLLYRNINRGSKRHLFNVIYTVITYNGWSNDTVEISCCCSSYLYSNKKLSCTSIPSELADYDENSFNDGCNIPNCEICNVTSISNHL